MTSTGPTLIVKENTSPRQSIETLMSDNNTMKAKESLVAEDTGCDFMKNSKINNEEKSGEHKKGKAASAAY